MNASLLAVPPSTAASETASWLGCSVTVPCTVELSNTAETLHAHVELDGIEVGPGDEVLVHDAPFIVAFGEHTVYQRSATVSKASWLTRTWTRMCSRFELTALYEVSFSPDRLCQSHNFSRSGKP